ncbi:hypothetical protein Klosneuvirus_1_208 [Klosneuvirus KNV1]|uniref:Uncharacterized protein n=1 Tax=Klosneuvirus KNV1 TaxID=1977640 RepID=A0A1V0SI58_9VIRU|nr:hypothetical protein Klosneuvirus_1_208 [Klosneuvirus KNV1]
MSIETSDNIENTSSYDDNEDNDDLSENEKIPTINELKLSKKEIYDYKRIDKFYKSRSIKDVQSIIDIVEGKSNISLRLLDWFVTTYADRYKTKYILNNKITTDMKMDDEFDKKIEEIFVVHISYKAQLRTHKKKYFDPFRREKGIKKFLYYFDKDKTTSLCTTLGQLNFFKWALQNDIIKYVNENYTVILKTMAKTKKAESEKKKDKKNSETKTDTDENNKNDSDSISEVTVKKHGVNINAKKEVTNKQVKIVLSFD